MSEYLLYIIGPLVLGIVAQQLVQSTFAKYGRVATSSGLTGAQVAQRILSHNGLDGVEIVAARGSLTDHYDPRKRTVNLSEPVFGGNSVSSAAVAAHEVGHAIQHAQGYAFLKFRSALWPVVTFASNTWFFVLLAGALLNMLGLVTVALALFAAVVLFQLVTLPVEFDASRRARKQLDELGLLTRGEEAAGAAKVLRAAALTYVAGALASLLVLLYYIGVFRR
jgi:Zn-dependent membrane protease YugP